MAKQCLYEVLGLERGASNDDIRAAYRRQALKWHPDKIQQNGASAQEATERFQLISRAYEVLGDPAERAWYDSHYTSILSEADSDGDFEFNIWPYFSPSAFSGYGDTGKGFYAVYASVFDSIFRQECNFARTVLSEFLHDPPSFGGPDSPHEAVSAFYRHWKAFKTVKDYSWCDEYRPQDAENRKVRRLMIEENNKIRKREQREFNDAVRQLVAFVKKRDKRVLERQVELANIQKEKEAAQKARREQLKQEKLARMKEYEEAEWSKAEVDEDKYYNWDGVEARNDSQEAEEKRELFCVICNKRFRSEKQWENHERSKKHRERAAELKDAFLDEDRHAVPVEDEAEDEQQAVLEAEELEETYFDALDAEAGEAESNSKSEQATASGSEQEENDESLVADLVRSQGSKSGVSSDEEEGSLQELEAARKQAELEKNKNQSSSVGAEEASVSDGDSQRAAQQRKRDDGKKNRKKKTKTATVKPVEQQQQQQSRKSGKGKKKTPCCEVCGQEFESRNSLFKHIDTSKHAVLK